MPAGDRTGPVGMGPRTGRGAGFCSGYSVPGYMNPIPRGGFWGRGRGGRGGGGRGWRNWYYATGLPGWQRAAYGWPGAIPQAYYPNSLFYSAPFSLTKEQELETLKEQFEFHKETLEGLKQRIAELESQSESK